MAGGLASFFAPLRGTNPPCIRLPASVRSDNGPCHSDNPPSPFAPRTSHFALRPSALSLRRSARRTGARERGRTGCRSVFQNPNEVRRPAPGPENGRTGLAREGGNRVRAIWATRPRDSGFGIRDSGFGIRDSGFGIGLCAALADLRKTAMPRPPWHTLLPASRRRGPPTIHGSPRRGDSLAPAF